MLENYDAADWFSDKLLEHFTIDNSSVLINLY